MLTKQQQAALFVVAVIFMTVWANTNWAEGDTSYNSSPK